jgi:hypothetical protein
MIVKCLRYVLCFVALVWFSCSFVILVMRKRLKLVGGGMG